MNERKIKVTVARESAHIFTAVSDSPYWSDGSHINARLAIKDGVLSSIEAQRLDRQNGQGYLLIAPLSIRREVVVAQARNLAIGESFSFSATLTINI